MALFANKAFLCVLLAGITADAARIIKGHRSDLTRASEVSRADAARTAAVGTTSSNHTAAARRDIHFPVKLVGMSSEEMSEVMGNDIYPFLQADLVYLKRLWRADPDFFEKKFPNAVLAEYTDSTVEGIVGDTMWKGALAYVGEFLTLGEPLGNLHTLGSWILDGHDWSEWLQEGERRVLQEGQDATVQYIGDATMGNLWEALVDVNTVQLVGTTAGGTTVFNDDGSERTLPETTILTPIRKGENLAKVKDVIWVAWQEGGALHHAWVRAADVAPSVYMVSSLVEVAEAPSRDAKILGTIDEEELFAVTSIVQDSDGEFWMELSDGSGYVRYGRGGYTGPLRRAESEGEVQSSRIGLQTAHQIHTSKSARCLRLAYNVGMFAAGFYTGGATWTIATYTTLADLGAGAMLDGVAMTDLDARMEYLLMQLRSWELENTYYAKTCNIRTNPCMEKHTKCIREMAFVSSRLFTKGDGWCMHDKRPMRENGQRCMVHADCVSGNCMAPEGCQGRSCLKFQCRDFQVPAEE